MAFRIHARASGICLAALGLTLTACGSSQDVDVGNVTEQFYGSIGRADGAQACALLTPSTRTELEQSSGKGCEQAILEELTEDRRDDYTLEVFGTMAVVEDAADTVFLTRLQNGWHVLAAGCAPRHDAPYDCAVAGG